jgi:hypothetical protein
MAPTRVANEPLGVNRLQVPYGFVIRKPRALSQLPKPHDHERDGGRRVGLCVRHDGERPKVDRAVLSLLKSEALHPADFTIREDGVVRLNPELARRITQVMASAP